MIVLYLIASFRTLRGAIEWRNKFELAAYTIATFALWAAAAHNIITG